MISYFLLHRTRKCWAHALLFLLSFPLHAADLNVASWGGAYQAAQREIFFKPFEKETEKSLAENVYDGGLDEIEGMFKKEKLEWDVVEIDAADFVLGCQKNYFEVLNWQTILPRSEFMKDTSHPCGVGAVIWAMALAFNGKNFVEDKPLSWKDFWDVQKFPGKRALRKTAKTTLEIALMADDVKASDVYAQLRDPRGIERALKKLDELYPHLIWWQSGDEPVQLLATNSASLVAAYNGRIAEAVMNGQPYQILWRDAIFSNDYWAILKNAPNKDAGYQFLKFISQPKLQAELAERIAYGPTLKRAYKLLGRQQNELMPDAQNKARLMLRMDHYFWALSGKKAEEKFQKWLKEHK